MTTEQDQSRLAQLVASFGLIAGAGAFVGVYAIVGQALIEGRPLKWWLRSDYCPAANEVCGGPPMWWFLFLPVALGAAILLSRVSWETVDA